MIDPGAERRTKGGPPPPLRPELRLDPGIFQLPIEKMRSGYYSDKYFLHTRDVLLAQQNRTEVTVQAFAKKHAWLGGIDEAIAILKLCLTEGHMWESLGVRALRDGDRITPWEPVLEVTGPYAAFAHLETLYLGVLSRRTKVATNTRRVVEAAWPKPVMFFPARHDHWLVQTGDGYAAHVSGAIGVSTDAQASWWGSKGIGTVPHALIACFAGDTVTASRAVADQLPEDVHIISLVDFDNDSVGTSLAVARALGSRLWGVRLDTSETMVDRSILTQMGTFNPTGVNPRLVHNVRDALDAEGFLDVRIVVSGGFDAEKIELFERQGVPVDSYGVGSSLFKDRYDFTADVVKVDGQPLSKMGRAWRENVRLQDVE
jgi:nicotinate phosphoribosyltransferase